MMINKGCVSIVTVVFNGVVSIEDTILSIINQTYDNIEYIIIDGGSIDGTQDVIKKYEERIFYWKSEPDKGIYDAMNKGIATATGEYIIFMNGGDKFHDFNTVKKIFIENTNQDLIYGNTLLYTDGETCLSEAKNFEKIKYGMPFCHQSVFVKLEIMKKHNFSLDYRLASDYNFFMSLYNEGKYSFKKTEELISIYDNCGASMSLLTIKEKFLIAKNYYPYSSSSAFHYGQLTYYTLTAFLKRILPKSILTNLIKFKRKIWFFSL